VPSNLNEEERVSLFMISNYNQPSKESICSRWGRRKNMCIIAGISFAFFIFFHSIYGGKKKHFLFKDNKKGNKTKESETIEQYRENGNTYKSFKKGGETTKSEPSEVYLQNFTTIISFMEDEVPECIAPNKQIQLRNHGKFIPSNHVPRYDYKSGFLMKARYNCAHPPEYNSTTGTATDYQLVLNYGDSNNACDLRSMINKVGGPQGTAKMLGITNKSNRPYHVLIQGTSYLRQVFEALVDGFQDQITDILLQSGGMDPGPKHTVLNIDQLGTFLGMEDYEKDVKRGCHASGEKIATFYQKGVIPPPEIMSKTCGDNIAMVEFGGVIRFYYIFRPQKYAKKILRYIYQNVFGFTKNDEIDILIWNKYNHDPSNSTPDLRPKQQMDFSLLKPLKKMQWEQLGYFYGADNPYIEKPPDVHACMPGVPDDEVDILLYILLTGYKVEWLSESVRENNNVIQSPLKTEGVNNETNEFTSQDQ